MDAQSLTKALGGRWSGLRGSARCPAHEDRTPSLTIRDGDTAPLLKCHAGCSQVAIIDALCARGLWQGGPWGANGQPDYEQRWRDMEEEARRRKAALDIWRASKPALHTLAEIYLRSRGITIQPPPSLRFHWALKHSPTGLRLPAMVAAIQAPNRSITAVLRTFLSMSGAGKALVSAPKMALGQFGSGAVRLGPAGPALGIAEGIETGLSAMQLFEIPIWCRCGSSLEALQLPDEVRELQVFGDNGEAGRIAAERARDYAVAAGKRVFIRRPPEHLPDWNDALWAMEAPA